MGVGPRLHGYFLRVQSGRLRSPEALDRDDGLSLGRAFGLALLSDRILGDKPEDPRYADIRERWGSFIGLKFFFFFQFQGVLVVLLSIPFALLALDPLDRITGYEWAGLLLWAIALGGEMISDAQLKHFKADPDNEGHVCDVGLWHHSRHPNYFFEWLVWVSYFIAALATDYGLWTIICPLVMLFFLLRVTGIPATEAHALQSRGEEYAEYQRTTSMFIPWFKKECGLTPSYRGTWLPTR